MEQNRPRSITVMASLMIVFGAAEAVTGFTHDFFGLKTTQGMLSACAGAAIGALYSVAGLLFLTMRKRAAILAIALLVAVIGGRVAMVFLGLYPLDSPRQVMAIVLGTSLVAGFAIYFGLKLSAYG
jgi:hypothetical protein